MEDDMGVVLAPILEGQLDAWKKWCADLQGPQKEAVADFNKRYGLTRHASWLAETPAGPMVIALHEGPGSDELMPKLAASDNAFDISFKEHLLAVHGMDVTQPPPGPMPKNYFDSTG
jgi:hypothetical protein